MTEPTVFFADILGFGAMSRTKGGGLAVDALSDLATILSDTDEVARFLRRGSWRQRYALSDSLFLVSDNTQMACANAAELYNNLAYLNSHLDADSVLLRGGIAIGEVKEIKGLFEETGEKNLVGAAVVEAVNLEKNDARGPRLFISDRVASVLETSRDGVSWLLDRKDSGPPDLLWLLPPDPDLTNPTMIKDVCSAAVTAFLRHCHEVRVGSQYVGFLELIARCLERLQKHRREGAAEIVRAMGLQQIDPNKMAPEVRDAMTRDDVVGRLERAAIGG